MFSGLHSVQLNAFHKITAQYFLISFKFKHIAEAKRELRTFWRGIFFGIANFLYKFYEENSEQWTSLL